MRRAVAVALVAALAGCAGTQPLHSSTPPKGVHLVEFDNDADLARFDFTDADAFAIEGGSLVMVREAKHEPRYRSPFGLAILRTPPVADFVMRCRARQTGREYGHRDLVFVFGYQDADHFYYAHLATKADQTAHHVMIVDGADRRPITTWRTDGVEWGGTDRWHTVTIEREGALVRVVFDGQIVLEAEDHTLGAGLVGVGSFDDTGAFDDIVLFKPTEVTPAR